ncbi:MAG: N-acetylmuramoyl-L-alanine amidase [Planctomycetales bacterium]|nr:N-acetylmuramoyl-L-alanine amidase [Planctomycetales bacterium]
MSAARLLAALVPIAAGCQLFLGPAPAGTSPGAAVPPSRGPEDPPADPPLPAYARFLAELHVCLDPGHGGDAHIPNYKRGPTGLREADANLRVARALRDLLAGAGAKVTLTREGDEDVSLARRSEIANACGADVFLSLHHNASEKPEVNGTTTWYHGDPDHSPASLDLARHVQFGVGEALGTPRWIVCPLLTDTLMYKTGFAVLRRLEIPGCLGEASYHTNPGEERRLRDPAYNRREAWGYFLALARYAAGGLPRVRLVSPKAGEPAGPRPELRARIEDGVGHRGGWGGEIVRIVPSSVTARLDGAPVPFAYDPKTGDVTATPGADLPAGDHALEVRAENIFGNHVVTRPLRFRVEEVPGPGESGR